MCVIFVMVFYIEFGRTFDEGISRSFHLLICSCYKVSDLTVVKGDDDPLVSCVNACCIIANTCYPTSKIIIICRNEPWTKDGMTL